MKIGFVFTNYNNSLLSIQAAKSIARNHGICDYEIVLVDNASIEKERLILAEQGVLPSGCTVLWNTSNVGYFDGLNRGMDVLFEGASDFDLIVVGNNDLVFERDFFESLMARSQALVHHSVVSPAIMTLDHEHQNPHVSSGISRFREIIWDVYFSNFWLSQLIGWTAQQARAFFGRKDYLAHSEEGPIYQGYGACYILTPRFFQLFKRLWAPGFVMGEEFYLARQLAAQGEKMYYIPDILVHHHDHATIGKIPSRHLWKMTRHYHGIYRFFVNPYRLQMDNGKTPADYDRSFKSGNN